ncbi:MAG: hypothetical protein D6679_02845 [Candidatus Hydrogenedentota bacterium]|nr:MAG: hypothetical protein D6679_02845 [Candidatus Hydrogenedentota bacterium]
MTLRRYEKPELTFYGSAEIGYFSPSNMAADCSCDCAAHPAGNCYAVGFLSCDPLGPGGPCVSSCNPACDEFSDPC